ncbi:hypothetical protein HPB48_017190 [Haemaphysalis longicornis]|uniref:Kinesin motor domain-containing protein n=1 Tax=Haemaphysalis longicornis TaxID=44386 RepID=A0A9J6FGH3_HAELO|nr:hypothetical protein HPB48_017190 [Haemaphysalis longicornis]
MADGAVKVAVRVRPPSPQEQNQCAEGSIEVLPEQAQLVVAQEYGFTFDYTFDTTATQEDVYTRCVADLIGKVTTGESLYIWKVDNVRREKHSKWLTFV